MTPADRNHLSALERENRELREENTLLREQIANAHNFWRHEFDAEVEAAANKLFQRLSAINVLRSANALRKEPAR